jgi:branched-chain amino acid transport system substrate-binding protein
MRVRRALAALLALALLAAAAAPAVAGAPPVRIGVTLGLTGRYARLAAFQQNGFRLWEEDVNARGGLAGRRVEVTILDDGGDPAAAAALYARFTEQDRLDLVFGPYSSDVTAAVLPVTERTGYPVIVSGASADALWERGYRHAFGLFLPASRLTVGFLDLLNVSGLDRVAIVADDSAFGHDVAAGAATWTERFGLRVVHRDTLARGAANAPAVVAAARRADAEVLLLAASIEESAAVIAAARDAGWSPRAVYAPVGPGTEGFRTRLGAAAEGVFSTTQWEYLGTVKTPGCREFVERYARAFGEQPSYFAATAYAAGQIMEAAVRAAGGLERARVSAALATMDAASIIGRYAVDRTGLQLKGSSFVVQIQGGALAVVWPREVQAAPPRFR